MGWSTFILIWTPVCGLIKGDIGMIRRTVMRPMKNGRRFERSMTARQQLLRLNELTNYELLVLFAVAAFLVGAL